MKKIYICSPYQNNPVYNTKVALRAAEAVTMINCMPIVPHIYFTQFLDENNQDQRNFGINCGIELLKSCDELWIIGTKITDGMLLELDIAKEIEIPVKIYVLNDKMLEPITDYDLKKYKDLQYMAQYLNMRLPVTGCIFVFADAIDDIENIEVSK